MEGSKNFVQRLSTTRISRPFLQTVALAILIAGHSCGSPSLDASEPADDFQAFVANAPLTLGALVQAPDAIPVPVNPESADAELDIDDVSRRSIFSDRKTNIVDGRFVLPPIEALTTNTNEIGNGEVPVGFRGDEPEQLISLPETGSERGVPWQWMTSCWVAPNTFTHPLYFEDRMLERHGHQCHHWALQPAFSGGRFVAQAAMLPYLSVIDPPCECDYTLGYYRAGNCVPALKQRPPYKRKAVAAQALGVGAFIAVFQ